MQTEPQLILPENFSVILARHAAPNRARTDIPYTVVPGPELTEQGLREAAQLGAFFAQAGVRRIFASPFERTLRTAHIAGAAVGVAPAVQADLSEWHTTDSEREIRARMLRAFAPAAALSAEIGAPVALVTHGGPIGALLNALGLSEDTVSRLRIFDYGNPVPTAGAWWVAKRPLDDGAAALTFALAFAPPGARALPEALRRIEMEIQPQAA
jgi:broad specificity phosphatase PhoE